MTFLRPWLCENILWNNSAIYHSYWWIFEKFHAYMIQVTTKYSGISSGISPIILLSFTDATKERFILTSPYVWETGAQEQSLQNIFNVVAWYKKNLNDFLVMNYQFSYKYSLFYRLVGPFLDVNSINIPFKTIFKPIKYISLIRA